MKTWKILLIVITAGITGFATVPFYKEYKVLNTKLDQLQKNRDKKIEEQKELAKIKKEIENDKKNFLTKIPAEVEQEKLIMDLLSIATKTGFGFSDLSFSQGKNAKLGIPQINISFSTEGNKNQLIDFLKNIEENERFMGMENFSITTSKDDKQSVSLGVSLYAYFQDESASNK